MWAALSATVALFALVSGVCHNYEKDYYEEIGCKPEKLDESGCPTSYDCSSLTQRSSDQCHYQGKSFPLDHKLEQTPDTSCLVECRCQNSITTNDKTAFSCISIECPELFRGPPAPNCYRTYKHGECCSIEEKCNDAASQKTAKDVCTYKDKTYFPGEKFYPEEEPCLECICQPGFKGKLEEPFCQKVRCHLELHNGHRIAQGCVPVFYGEKGCCPIDWRCPEKTDSAVPQEGGVTKSATDSGKSCKFGEVTLRVGDKLSPSLDRPNTECSCRVPPHPVCIQPEIPYPGPN